MGFNSAFKGLIARTMRSVPCLLGPNGYLITREDDGVWNDKESHCILWDPPVYDGL